jgi:cysteinyl-tRNA synthetase
LSLSNKEKILKFFKKVGEEVLGLIDLTEKKSIDDKLVDELMKIIIDIRSQMRAEKRFDIADRIRDELKKLNIELEDKKGLTTYKILK